MKLRILLSCEVLVVLTVLIIKYMSPIKPSSPKLAQDSKNRLCG